jgi:DNA-binding CsgD family transcriptional regulator
MKDISQNLAVEFFSATNIDELTAALDKTKEDLEFDSFYYGQTSMEVSLALIKARNGHKETPIDIPLSEISSLKGFFAKTDVPLGWKKKYIDRKFYLSDPRIWNTANSMENLVWDRDDFSKMGHDEIFDGVAEYGVQSGVAVSYLTPDKNMNVMNVNFSGRLATQNQKEKVKAKLPLFSRVMTLYQAVASGLIRENVTGSMQQIQLMALTNREAEILKHLASGSSYFVIADNLNITESTVRFHLKNIVDKLKCTNKIEALALALRSGLI